MDIKKFVPSTISNIKNVLNLSKILSSIQFVFLECFVRSKNNMHLIRERNTVDYLTFKTIKMQRKIKFTVLKKKRNDFLTTINTNVHY